MSFLLQSPIYIQQVTLFLKITAPQELSKKLRHLPANTTAEFVTMWKQCNAQVLSQASYSINP